MSKLILMRHGESCWNKLNVFTGWVDVPLSAKGIQEALEGGQKIKDLPIDVIITSSLVRAQMTAFLAISQHSSGKTPVVVHEEDSKLREWGQIYSEITQAQCIPVLYSWELNERMYGTLQGLNKAETIEKFGADQVQQWRRSYHTKPPEGESLAMTAARAIPYFTDTILPYLTIGSNVFVSAHGNSLRAICMVLDNLTEEEVLHLEIATGVPIVYDYQDGTFAKDSLTL
jgi:2,3-bisphosphoglycerate-dependent phosphoglycerate mutase